MLSTRMPKPSPPSTKVPQSSGPRWAMALHIRRISASLTGADPTLPAIPHISGCLFPAPGYHHVAGRDRDEVIQHGPGAQRGIDRGVQFIGGAHFVQCFSRHRRRVAVEVLLFGVLALHRLSMVGVVEQILDGFGE